MTSSPTLPRWRDALVLLVATWLALVLAFAARPARAALEIDVVGGTEAAQPIAIVPFGLPQGMGFDAAAVIERDLASSGYFVTLPRAAMPERPDAATAVNTPAWQQTQVGGRPVTVVVTGRMEKIGGGVGFRFGLTDVVRNEVLFEQTLAPVSNNLLRVRAHQIADAIFERLTGKRGVFDTQLAYVTATGYGNSRGFGLVVCDADGENPIQVVSSNEALMSPAWSPDGNNLAFVGFNQGQSGIYVYNLDSGRVRRLVAEPGINGAPEWSPDGKTLLVTLSYETNSDLYLVNVADGAKRRLTTHYGIDTEGTFSPDGRQIAFTSDRGGSAQIYVMNADGGDAKRVTFDGRQSLRPRFSPDGKSLVFVRNLGGNRFVIDVQALGENTARQLTDGPGDTGPSFAPNGESVIYTAQGGKGTVLATVSLDGKVKRVIRDQSEVSSPAWSPFPRR